MIFTTDDLCLSYLDNFELFDDIKAKHPEFKLIAFTIANFNNEELLVESDVFKTWYAKHRDWVEIAVHSYDHANPPDGDRDNEEYWINKALDSLRPFLPARYGYRSPGWQTTNQTVGILKKLGFAYIAYESKIKDLMNNTINNEPIINSHIYDINSIKRIEEVISK